MKTYNDSSTEFTTIIVSDRKLPNNWQSGMGCHKKMMSVACIVKPNLFMLKISRNWSGSLIFQAIKNNFAKILDGELL